MLNLQRQHIFQLLFRDYILHETGFGKNMLNENPTKFSSKGLFYIDIRLQRTSYNEYFRCFKALHLMYSGVMSWRLGKGVYEIKFYKHNERIAVVKVMVL